MNVATFVGHVGKDAKLEKTGGGKAVATFSIAIANGKEPGGEKRAPIWVKCLLWEKRAETLAPHISKGKTVAVSGPVHVETWLSHDGQPQSALVCTAREFTFCGAPTEDSKPAKVA